MNKKSSSWKQKFINNSSAIRFIQNILPSRAEILNEAMYLVPRKFYELKIHKPSCRVHNNVIIFLQRKKVIPQNTSISDTMTDDQNVDTFIRVCHYFITNLIMNII